KRKLNSNMLPTVYGSTVAGSVRVFDLIEASRSKIFLNIEMERFARFGKIWKECFLETDIRQKDKKPSQKRQNRARNRKAWRSQS
ncbi:hypothetical protein Tco_0176526, partial [Tanacetum coccineum]